MPTAKLLGNGAWQIEGEEQLLITFATSEADAIEKYWKTVKEKR